VTDQRRPLLLAAGCLLVFVVLLVLVAVDSPVDRLDHAIRDRLAAHPDRPLFATADHITDVFSPLLDALVLTIGATAVAWRQRRIGPLVAVAVTGWVMVALVESVKYGLDRPPPFPVDPGSGRSFPSGHTAAALVCFGALALVVATERPRWARPLLLAAAGLTLVVAAALVWANYHWLSDAVGSIAIGVALVVPLRLWLRRGEAA
jgi:membrane-associated phospholipid phosphatase